MSRTPASHADVFEAVLNCIANYPQGIGSAEIQALLSEEHRELCEAAIGSAHRAGWIEPSPIFAGRWRWARSQGPFAQAAAWVRLRRRARQMLADIHRCSGLPVTLHVLIGRAHTVIQRFPADPLAAIAGEVSRYAAPRALHNGMTSKVFLACLPVTRDEVGLLDEQAREAIRSSGYGYALAAKAGLGGVLSAPICVSDAPVAAFCTFGAAERLSPDRIAVIGPVMAAAATQLAAKSQADAPILRPSLDPGKTV